MIEIQKLQETHEMMIDAMLGAWLLESLRRDDADKYADLKSWFLKTNYFKDVGNITVDAIYKFAEFKSTLN